MQCSFVPWTQCYEVGPTKILHHILAIDTWQTRYHACCKVFHGSLLITSSDTARQRTNVVSLGCANLAMFKHQSALDVICGARIHRTITNHHAALRFKCSAGFVKLVVSKAGQQEPR